MSRPRKPQTKSSASSTASSEEGHRDVSTCSAPLADFDDFWDTVFHRPAAACFLGILLDIQSRLGCTVDTGVTPNQITFVATATGLAGAVAMFHGLAAGSAAHLQLAGVLIMLACIFDCMDGQLARKRAKPSPLGKYVDGVGDLLMMIFLTAAFICGVWFAWGPVWFWAAFAACICLQQHFILFDKVCFTYSIQTKDAEGLKKTLAECDLEIVSSARRAAWRAGDRFAWIIWAFACLYVRDLAISAKKAELMRRAAQTASVAARNDALYWLQYIGMGSSMVLWYGALLAGSQQLLAAFIALQLTVSMVYHVWVFRKCQAAALYMGVYSEGGSVIPYALLALSVDLGLRLSA